MRDILTKQPVSYIHITILDIYVNVRESGNTTKAFTHAVFICSLFQPTLAYE